MPMDHQGLQGWVSHRSCDLRNALEFSDHATIGKVGSLLSQGIAQLASGSWDVPMDGTTRSALMVSLIVVSDAKRRAVCRQCVAIHGGEPSVRSCCGLQGVRVGEASHPGPPGQSPDDILSDLEAVLTRIDSSDEEALVRPTTGRHMFRKVREEQRRLVPSDAELQRQVHTIRVGSPQGGAFATMSCPGKTLGAIFVRPRSSWFWRVGC